MRIREIKVKSILVKSKLPESGLVINPYIGCEHACAWCYARFMKRFTDHDEPWGSFVDIKINAPELLEKQLIGELLNQVKRSGVFLSSVTDCYQPLEEKYQLTRQILKILLKHQIPISILTNSTLVIRDLDLLTQFKGKSVGFTLYTLDDKIAKIFQPKASLPSQKVSALKTFHDKGIETYIHVGPYLPEITNLEEILKAVYGRIDFFEGEMLNTKGANFTNVALVLKTHFPEILEKYKRLFFSGELEKLKRKINQEFQDLSKKYKIRLLGFWVH